MSFRISAAILAIGLSTGLSVHRPDRELQDRRIQEEADQTAVDFRIDRSAFDFDSSISFDMDRASEEVPYVLTSADSKNAQAAPEPATFAALAIGSGLLLRKRRRRN